MARLRITAILIVLVVLLVGCAGAATPAAEQAAAPAAEQQAAAPAADAPAAAPADSLSVGTVKDVAREDTLILGWSVSSPLGVTNPWASPGYSHQEANAMLWEGLAYFQIYADREQPWLAESMEYSKEDFTELTIKLRPGAKWSDGQPVTSKDVVFTFDGQLNRETLPYHAAFKQFVEKIEAVDDLTVVVTFNQPAPRFKFEVLTLKFDTGIPIVPAHVLEGQEDVNAFTGGLDMPHSGPYSTVFWNATQKILDLREDWWAVETGLVEMPDVKRIIMVNIGGQVGQSMEVVAQRVTNNEFDTALDFRQDLISNILKQNPKVTSHTGNEAPYGYLDWWPNSLWVNTQLAPFDDVNVRRAISLAVDRDTIDQIVYGGAKVTTIYPFPLYPGLQKFADLPEVKALEEKYQPRKYDLAESASLMEAAGFTKNSAGLWEKDGQTVDATINGFEGIHSDIVTVLVEMLLQAGFDATINFGTNAYQNMADGEPGLYMFGHGASLIDPYAAFELYHGRYSAAIGTTAGSNRFSRYSNPEYDAILDEMAPLDSDDPRFTKLAIAAMDHYWANQIDIPIIQWLHRNAYNQTYWTNWPTTANLGPGVNGAFWHHTGMLVVTNLKKAQ